MKHLELTWTISKARDSYGYNRLTLWDGSKKYVTCGGGYDMVGSVFAYWLWDNYKDEIIAKIKPHGEEGGLYGYHIRGEYKGIDGACGLDCMIRIAKAIGLDVKSIWNERKKATTHFIITDI